MEIVRWVMSNWMEVLLGSQAMLGGALALALLIPGDQPDKALQSIVNLLSKFSKKK